MKSAQSPGKIILSGEHAVVHGCPALVVAVDHWASVFIESGALRRNPRPEIDKRYARFLAGDLPIQEVVLRPEDLCDYAASLVCDEPVAIRIESELPIGSGMGSSAAICLAIMRALAPDLSDAALYEHALRTENLQHGQSSGVDPHVCLYGGAWRYQREAGFTAIEPPATTLHLVHSGKPESSTGECVMAVRQHFPANDPIWAEFEAVTAALERGLDPAAIRENQQLLERIGVVPEPVARFCRALADEGLAAKVCGAGAVRGVAGGTVLVLGGSPPSDLLATHGYTTQSTGVSLHGTRLYQP